MIFSKCDFLDKLRIFAPVCHCRRERKKGPKFLEVWTPKQRFTGFGHVALKLNIKGEWSDHFYRLVTSRQPSMQQQLLCHIFILIFLKESALAIDLCLFIQCNPQNENGSGRSDSGPTVIQIDQDWIQPENSQNDQLYHFGNNANSMNW